MYTRRQSFKGLDRESTLLLLGSQGGKNKPERFLLLKNLFPGASYFDLLLSSEYERFLRNPSYYCSEKYWKAWKNQVPVIIMRYKKIPSLLNEVQWLMVNKNLQFILCGVKHRENITFRGKSPGWKSNPK